MSDTQGHQPQNNFCTGQFIPDSATLQDLSRQMGAKANTQSSALATIAERIAAITKGITEYANRIDFIADRLHGSVPQTAGNDAEKPYVPDSALPRINLLLNEAEAALSHLAAAQERIAGL